MGFNTMFVPASGNVSKCLHFSIYDWGMLHMGLVNVPFWGLVSHHQNKYLLEKKYPRFSWVMWNIGTFTNPCYIWTINRPSPTYALVLRPAQKTQRRDVDVSPEGYVSQSIETEEFFRPGTLGHRNSPGMGTWIFTICELGKYNCWNPLEWSKLVLGVGLMGNSV